MHGLVNRSIQRFVCDRFGTERWYAVTEAAGIEVTDFEGMLTYPEDVTVRLLDAMPQILGLSRADIMEDIGTFLVASKGFERIRRLLRFGGVDFVDFLQSLDDLPDRVRLAVPELQLPWIELHTLDTRRFELICDGSLQGYGHVLTGLLRAMADDYGALVVLEHKGAGDGAEKVCIQLVDAAYSEGRHFALGVKAG